MEEFNYSLFTICFVLSVISWPRQNLNFRNTWKSDMNKLKPQKKQAKNLLSAGSGKTSRVEMWSVDLHTQHLRRPAGINITASSGPSVNFLILKIYSASIKKVVSGQIVNMFTFLLKVLIF